MIRRSLRRLATLLAFVAALASGLETLPHALTAVRLVRVALDPVQQTQIELEAVPSEQILANAKQALGEGDGELAASYLVLADGRSLAVPDDLRQAVTDANAFDVAEFGGDVWAGFVHGEATTPAGFGAALALDLTAIGDVKDLVVQAAAYPDHDILIMSLASIGLALTGASVVSVGAATPAKLGASTLKIARKARLLHPRFVRVMMRELGGALRIGKIEEAATALRRLDITAARRAAAQSLDRTVLSRLQDSAADLGRVGRRQGVRGTLETLALVDRPARLRRLAAISEHFGPGYRAVLRLVSDAGRVAARLLRPLFRLLELLGTALLWLLTAFLLFRRSVRVIARAVATVLPPYPRRRTRRNVPVPPVTLL
ncbi:hypothetical protein JYU29_09865 [Tianweitania sp. BSSL-BM11]|uniref:DUF4349 domain-containing protein n=1 Tax=Tianweitania aestuarii TaxID=2814886 RepID=A0ABS5RXN1_9HYPH|nr:hypothetical protein [Tianweitania aestuarii]MBS9720989.1 hypothetical protein [Tianweitania aestuarii]